MTEEPDWPFFVILMSVALQSLKSLSQKHGYLWAWCFFCHPLFWGRHPDLTLFSWILKFDKINYLLYCLYRFSFILSNLDFMDIQTKMSFWRNYRLSWGGWSEVCNFLWFVVISHHVTINSSMSQWTNVDLSVRSYAIHWPEGNFTRTPQDHTLKISKQVPHHRSLSPRGQWEFFFFFWLAASAANHYTTRWVRRPAIYTATQS